MFHGISSELGQSRYNELNSRSIILSESVDLKFMIENKFSFAQTLKDQHCNFFFETQNRIYPRPVKVFFMNLEKHEPMKKSITPFYITSVKGTQITLIHSQVEKIYNFSFDPIQALDTDHVRDLRLLKYAKPHTISKRASQLSCTDYVSEPILIHYILVRTIYPKKFTKRTQMRIWLS